jgi:hypothetical protein
MKQLRDAITEALQQVQYLIESCDEQRYNQPCIHSESGVGRHVRHILDHFLALQDGLDKNLIDYNKRHHDSSIEDNPAIALALIFKLQNWFIKSDQALADRTIKVESEISVSHQENMCFTSTINRELCYLINHTLHHVAYAKLVAKSLDIKLDDSIGIAPSTASYLRQQGS